MGIKHFFTWFRTNFGENIKILNYNQSLEQITTEEKKDSLDIDNLMIDMNGLFHTSAQKIYKYGEFKQRERLLGNTAKINFIEAQTKVFEDICARLEKIMKLIKTIAEK